MSFRLKLFFIFTIIIIVLFLLAGILFFNQWKVFNVKSMVLNLKSYSEINTPKIVETYKKNVPNKTFFMSREIYYIREKQPILKDILIIKTNGTTSYEFSSTGREYGEKFREFVFKNAITFETSVEKIGNDLVIIVPYIDKWDRHFYSTVFVYSLSNIYNFLNRYIFYFVIFEIILISIALIIAYFLSRISTDRLERLTVLAKGLQRGEFEKPITLEGNDEFAQIARILEQSRRNTKNYVEKLNRTIEQLKESNVLKDQFLGNVSHELKTPLTSIIGYIDYLKNGKLGALNKEQKSAVEKISGNTAKLNELIGTLLLIQDKYKNKIEKIELNYIIKEVCDSYGDIIEKKGLKVECKFNEYDYILLADRDKLFSIFQHVIENAIKFTESGYIKVAVTESDKKKVRISIEDSGIGIPKDKIGKMFERFVQLDGTKTRKFGGVGIGLYTVKEFLDDMSGTINIESEEGKGTRAVIEIPYVRKLKSTKFVFTV